MSDLENALNGKSVAILVANGFEESHMTSLHKALVLTGANVKIVSPEKGVVNSWHGNGWGHFFPANAHLATSMSHHFDAVVIPGGSRHVNRLISDPQTARFMRGFMEDNKPVALVEDAPKILAEAGLLEARTVFAEEDIQDILSEKGATAADAEIHVDDMLVTSKFADEALVEKFADCILSYEPEAWEAA
ncbi:DJ-1/PfpI family protein [Sneathiella litorea]|uniref:Peptidase C56 n=1 Tax=Sneathiella litorea TaxID=2606216 RepID=A0A6L8W6C0_9PROT|nr:DJ-1/PfpI family protein [Sneathiella litorea]MZR30608.1 peptidase C56 [Sneathiella litorea]